MFCSFSILAEEEKANPKGPPPPDEINDLKKSYKTDFVDVYINQRGYASSKTFTDATIVKVPVKLYFDGPNSCQIGCISGNKEDATYIDGGKDYVVGFIKVKGAYNDYKCEAYGVEHKQNLSSDDDFLALCQRLYSDVFKDNLALGIATNTGRFFDSE